MLPFAPGFAGQEIGGAGRKRHRNAPKAGRCPLAETQDRRGAERNAYDLVELRPVAVPTDASARIVTSDKRMRKIAGRQAGELGGPRSNGYQPWKLRSSKS